MPSSWRNRGGALRVSWLCLSAPLAKSIPSSLAPFLILDSLHDIFDKN